MVVQLILNIYALPLTHVHTRTACTCLRVQLVFIALVCTRACWAAQHTHTHTNNVYTSYTVYCQTGGICAVKRGPMLHCVCVLVWYTTIMYDMRRNHLKVGGLCEQRFLFKIAVPKEIVSYAMWNIINKLLLLRLN